MPTPQPVQQVPPPPTRLPRIVIAFCTQCKWNLRAAYFAQELLSTFGNSLGEVALRPETGGLFTVHLTYIPSSSEQGQGQQKEKERTVLLWDRKSAGGFPETKELKQRVRDCIAPSKDLGHSDVGGKKNKASSTTEEEAGAPAAPGLLEVANVRARGAQEEQESGQESKAKLEDPSKGDEKCEDCS